MGRKKPIAFVRRPSSARLRSPLEGFEEVTSRTEYRVDPLSGRVAMIGLNLAGKRNVLISETDEALISKIAKSTQDGCFFCPERVETVTPKYPEGLLPGADDGRMRRGTSLLFPNLFPLGEYHAVIALGHEHFRRLDEFSPELLEEGIGLAVDFVGSAAKIPGVPAFWTVCCNYLQPGGASIIHPHIQILGTSMPLTTSAVELEKAAAYSSVSKGGCYFEDLVEVEREDGARFMADSGPVCWLAAFAPRGSNEVLGICADADNITALTEDHVKGLARGLSAALRVYHEEKLSTFNFCMYSGPIHGGDQSSRVYMSVVSRQSVVENYRCDDYFLQKMLGTEILIDPPEEVAKLMRRAMA